MADKNYGIQTGSRVDVKYSFNTDSDTASIFDPGYTLVNELAKFPEVKRTAQMNVIENYDSDFTSKQSGDIDVSSSQLIVNEVPGDESQMALKNAADARRLVRFQNIYVIDTGENPSGQQQGIYQIYDAYVSGYRRIGGESAVAQLAFNIEPTGHILAEGISQTGEVLHQGDFGLGAGTAAIPGPKDTSSFIGNSWRTFMGSNADNPIKLDTTLIHSQPNENKAWQITAPVDGTPGLYVRNIQKNDTDITKSVWAKVYTDQSKPTPDDIDAVSRKGDTMTGDLTINRGTTHASLNINGAKLRANGSNGPLVISSTNNNIIVRPSGDTANSANDFIYEPNGFFRVPTVIAGAVTIASQGKTASSALRYDTWNINTFQLRKQIGPADSWDDLFEPGVYKVQGAGTTTVGSPEGIYGYGMLRVSNIPSDTSERRTLQEYHPHRTGGDNTAAYCWRIYNRSGSGPNYWQEWNIVRNEVWNNARLVSRAGDTMTGSLEFNGRSLRLKGNGLDIGLAQDSTVFLGDQTATMNLRAKTAKDITVEVPGAKGVVYSTLNKPSAADVGATTIDDVDAKLDSRFISIANIGNAATWVKVGSVSNLIRGGRIITMIGSSGQGYNGRTIQNGTFELMLKTGDNAITGVNVLGRAALTVVNKGPGISILDAGVIESAANRYDIWLKFGAFVSTGWCRITSSSEAFVKSNWTSDGKTTQDATPTFVLESSVNMLATTTDVSNIWNGGTFKNDVTFEKSIILPKSNNGGDISSITPGNGDGAEYDKCNIDLRGHYGMGFWNRVTNNGIQGRVGYVDFRTGSIRMAGNATFDGVIAVGVSQKSKDSHTVATWDRDRQRMRFATDNIGIDLRAKSEDDIMYVGPGGKTAVFVNTLNAQKQLGSGFVSKTDTANQTIRSSLYLGGSIVPSIIRETFDANTPDADPSAWKDGIEMIATTNNVNGWPIGVAAGLKFRASMHRHGQLLIGQSNELYFRSIRADRDSNPWARAYTTAFKPTPGELASGGAYTKAEADGKYFLRSGGTISGAVTIQSSLTTSGQINSNAGLGAKSGGNPGAYGSYIQWGVTNNGSGAPTGAMHFTNHRGALTNVGGWIWESKGDGQSNQIKAALMTRDGDLTLQGGLTTSKQSNFNGLINIGKGNKIVINRSDFAINAIEIDSKNWLSIGDVKSSTVIKTVGLEVEVADGRRGKIFNELAPPTAAQCSAVGLGETIDEGTF
ncbi:hypothetical protein [Serratia ureilytica]|uniref:hypothetical protein n=1 Tax=Serratia ureilytica TaxID=300181 RepID=UPI0019D0D61F|nr:hypothetical protein [Serratia ureilytica]MBN5214275.1 hypothetical protein [Serratia ureilytica]